LILPKGTEVMNHRETSQMINGGTFGQTYQPIINIYATDYNDIHGLTNAIMDEINRRQN